eukprot:CAMPEP_0202957748 /NCGR_PEP_ID=MMETSP1396-20130829/2139_1 /ASSEMBLY_ACC=CAM_ASM_000872 /TAXON_ID= /ORGANISM="Pseudokeronopsis sp., Strain Brazil" /LENGTH=165 /DNA_ID=CAMNT_0049675423 /DNA_START=746 /DNA_END=1243 /DNA_ORIENTATION=-
MTINSTILSTFDIIAHPKDIHSVVSLGNDDQGEEDQDDNVLVVHSHIKEKTREVVQKPIYVKLPGDAFKDRFYMDWLISKKDQEEATADEFGHLLHQRAKQGSLMNNLGGMKGLMVQAAANPVGDAAQKVDLSLLLGKNIDSQVKKLTEKYPMEYLQGLSERELY